MLKSCDLIENYAKQKSYDCQSFETRVFGNKRSYMTVSSPKTGRGITFSVDSLTLPADARVVRSLFNHKSLSYEFAEAHGIRVLDTIIMRVDDEDISEAMELLERCGQVIVKPENGARGEGFVADITDEDGLRQALDYASEYVGSAMRVLVQEQFFGDELRLISIDGRVKSVLHSMRPFVIGDGESSIAELISLNNTERIEINSRVMIPYVFLDETNIPADILCSDEVLPYGEKFFLNHSTATKNGALIVDIFDKIDHSYIDIAMNLLSKFGRGMICLDLFVYDPMQPANEYNYAMVEMNEGISLPMCYRCIDGNHFDIMKEYVEPLIDATMR